MYRRTHSQHFFERAYAVAVGLILVLVIFVLVMGIGSVGIIGVRRWAKDPTMPKRLPGFNIFTGKWSDEEPPSGRSSSGRCDPS